MILDQKRVQAIEESLLTWYHANKRDLPWRHSTKPYDIWISEIMAQQTRITALLPYYQRFMAQFPDVQTLAAAREQEVLKAWEGLGYYSRARNLHKAAQIVVRDYNGQLPGDEKRLRALPGIGEYTAGAILSIAFGQSVPAVDGNVLRVHARVQLDDTEISAPAARSAVRAFTAACMPPDEPGHFTQALMELGALVCLPKTPLCPDCPLMHLCLARAQGRQAELPVKSRPKAKKEQYVTILVLTDRSGRVAMRRRTETLLHGLWEFVTVQGALSRDEIPGYLSDLGVTVRNIRPIGIADHVFTHIVWHMRGYRCEADSVDPLRDYAPVPFEEVGALAIPTAFQRFSKVYKHTPPEE